MRLQFQHRTIEPLESRRVLSAMADIVFVLDESGSQEIGRIEDGEALRPWVHQITHVLEDKLVSRGIGAASTAPNRYGVLAFGHEETRALVVNEDVFTSADKMDGMLAQFVNEGSAEDGWEAVANAVGVDSIAGQYAFRPGAAVHLILITDEGRQVPTKTGSVTQANKPLFFEMLEQLRAENLNSTKREVNVLHDAVLTTVTDFFFDEFEIFGDATFADEPANDFEPTIFGIDAHVLDRVNLDANRQDVADDLLPPGTADDVTIFTYRRADEYIESDDPDLVPFVVDAWRAPGDEAGSTIIDDATDYQRIRQAFAEPCTTASCLAGQYDSEQQDQDLDEDGNQPVIGQDGFESEEYAFLTWEARGTTWDFDVIRSEFQGWHDPAEFDSVSQLIEASSQNFGIADGGRLIHAFNQTFVDDLFEKIRIQVADFDYSKSIELADRDVNDEIAGGDFVAYMDVTSRFVNSPVEGPDIRLFDLDNDGVFIDLAQGKIDPDDVNLLVKIFATQIGDSNLDLQFSSSDLVSVFQRGEYEDGVARNSTWLTGDWNGDFEFNSTDFVAAFQANAFEQGFADRDNNQHIDALPIWAWKNEANFFTASAFYLPDWSDPRMQRR